MISTAARVRDYVLCQRKIVLVGVLVFVQSLVVEDIVLFVRNPLLSGAVKYFFIIEAIGMFIVAPLLLVGVRLFERLTAALGWVRAVMLLVMCIAIMMEANGPKVYFKGDMTMKFPWYLIIGVSCLALWVWLVKGRAKFFDYANQCSSEKPVVERSGIE